MTAPAVEIVLCSAVSDLPEEWMPEHGVIRIDFTEVVEKLRTTPQHWVSRPQAEVDERFKQWIPYILIQREDGALAAYPRKGSEQRLHGRWSLGIGGHINSCDRGAGDWADCVLGGLRRELREEFPGALEGTTSFLGLVHESLSAAGRVHIGAVFLHRTGNIDRPHTLELSGLEWLGPDLLGSVEWPLSRLESWSELALSLMRSI